jgi:hypothetical protein
MVRVSVNCVLPAMHGRSSLGHFRVIMVNSLKRKVFRGVSARTLRAKASILALPAAPAWRAYLQYRSVIIILSSLIPPFERL